MSAEKEEAELIASGYEWTCPDCGQWNTEIEACREVKCRKCEEEFAVSDHTHAYP